MTDRVYVDSNVLIYYVGGCPDPNLVLNGLYQHSSEAERAVSSRITLGECLRDAPRDAPDVSAIFLTPLSNGDFMSRDPVSLTLIKRAAELGAELNMKLIDTIHVATAGALPCDVFLTNGRGIRAPVAVALR
jgi:predicted nucleic acid-binding protein